MRLKIFDAVIAVLLISVTITVVVLSRISIAGQQTQISKVKIVQLPENDKLSLPLEIIPVNTEEDTSSSLPILHYKLKNNSTKSIEAISVKILIMCVDYEGTQTSSIFYIESDRSIHPDLAEYIGMQPIRPGDEKTVGPKSFKLPENFKEVKEVTIKLDFVLFDDGTFLNASAEGGSAILGRRRGAEKYKQWAKKFYKDNFESKEKLFEKMKEGKLPSDLNLDDYEARGAYDYRNFLVIRYTKGTLDKYIKEEK
jgi:hypothetical protein